jgi:hypothetical protein
MFVSNPSRPRTLGYVGIVITSIIGFASCASDDVGGATLPSASVEMSTPTPDSTTSTPTTELPDPVPVLAVYESVEFYPACGNEPLNHSGRTWYPIGHVGFDPVDASLQEQVDALLEVEREQAPVAMMRGFARVAPPGPGDDTGTLVVWADGVARWVSDSGDLDVWMIDDEVTYNWVC